MTETAAFEALRASPLATELTEAQCRTLSTLLALRELADGEVLVREGTSDSHLYALTGGSLRQVVVHYASVVSRGPSRVFGLERAQLESLLDSHPHIVYRVMRAITRRVHQTQHRLAAQSAELSNYIFKQHGRY